MSVALSTVWPGVTYLLLAVAAAVGAGALVLGAWRAHLFEGLVPFAGGFVAALAGASRAGADGVLLWLLGLLGGNLALLAYFRLGGGLVAVWALIGRWFATERRLATWIRRTVCGLGIAGAALLAASAVHAWPLRLMLAVVTAAAAGSAVGKVDGARVAAAARRSRLPERLRRLAAGLHVGLWLVVLFLFILWHTGSFEFRRAAPLVLLAAGIVLTACWPRLGDGILTCGLGALLLTLPWQLYEAFWPTLAVAAAGLILQVGLRRFRRPSTATEARPPERVLPAAALATGLAVVVSAALLLFAPVVQVPDTAPYADRLRRLQEKVSPGAAEGAVGFVVPASNNLYLSGVPWGFAWVDVAERPGWRTRLDLVARGRLLGSEIGDLRAVKEPAEIARLERSAEIVSAAFEDIVAKIAPGVSEGTIAELATRSMLAAGAEGLSFPAIVGSGYNATLPHYQENDATMQDGLVVIDIGCSFEGYASDMTRTFPVRGAFSEEERTVYGLVLAAQRAAVEACGPGVAFRDLHDTAKAVLAEAGYGEAFLHSVGHHVGLEVHDPQSGDLEPGMVITLEPGVYLPERALGVRIEDTFVVTEDGCRPLTRFATEPEDVEARMAEKKTHVERSLGSGLSSGSLERPTL